MQTRGDHKPVGEHRCGRCDQPAERTAECAGATCTLQLGTCCLGGSGQCADCDAEDATHAQRDVSERFELAEILLAGARYHIGASPYAGGR